MRPGGHTPHLVRPGGHTPHGSGRGEHRWPRQRCSGPPTQLVNLAGQPPYGKLTTWLATSGLAELTGPPVSLMTWSMVPGPLRLIVSRSFIWTPGVTGTSKACDTWMSGFTLVKM